MVDHRTSAEQVMSVPIEVRVYLLNEDNSMREVFLRMKFYFRFFIISFVRVLEMLYGQTDMGKVIDYISQAPDGFFLYLTHSYSRNDTRHSYYNLKFVFCFFSSFWIH